MDDDNQTASGDGRDSAEAGRSPGAAATASEEVARAHFERQHDPARVLAFSDGVFAIILTLLVLEIHVPELTQGQSLADALHEIRPSFVGFLISFIVCGMYWVNHRDLFALVRRTDRGLVWLNVLFLLPISLLPVGAALIGRYNDEPVALRVYGILLVAIALMRTVIWLYTTNRKHLLWIPLDSQQRRAGLVLSVAPGLVYFVAFLLATPAPGVSLLIYALLPLLYFLSITVLRSGKNRNKEFADFT